METETDFLETISVLVWNNISKQELIEMIKDRKDALNEQLNIPVVVDSKRVLKSWDNGYKQGYDDGQAGRKKHKDLNVY